MFSAARLFCKGRPGEAPAAGKEDKGYGSKPEKPPAAPAESAAPVRPEAPVTETVKAVAEEVVIRETAQLEDLL